MAWEVWKWLATGEVEFRVHAISRDAHIPNLVIRLGYRLVRGHERRLFLDSTRPPDAHVRASRPRRGRRGRAGPPRRRRADRAVLEAGGAAHQQLARNSEPQER